MTISATDIVVPVCSKMPLLYLLTQKVAQKFGYVLGIGGQKPQGRRGKPPSGARNRFALWLSDQSGLRHVLRAGTAWGIAGYSLLLIVYSLQIFVVIC